MTKKRIHILYNILLSTMLIVAGLCLILSCIGIYNTGDHPFSREAVATAFNGIAVPVYLCLALVLGGFILNHFLPLPAAANKPVKQNGAILLKLQSSFDASQCDQAVVLQIRKLRTHRRLRQGIGLGLLAVCSVIFLVYALNGNHFHQSDINGSMVKAMGVFIPCLAVPFAYAIWNAYCQNRSICQEIELLRQAPKKPAEKPDTQHKNVLRVIRFALLVVCIGILLYGFFSGGTQDVLTKAVNICTECVGLG